jgi:spore coat protein U-like protein
MSFTLRKALLVGLGAAAFAAGLPLTQAAAATATTTFSVTATVLTTCSVTATNLNFGPYSGVLVDAESSVSPTCSTGTPYTIGLTQGTATGATVSNRSMTGPAAELLHYELFQDSSHATPWGDTIGTDTLSSTGTGAEQTFPVFGVIPAGQFVQSGQYSDTVTVTLTF